MTYLVRDWNQHYEKSETRKLKDVKWISVPTDTSDKIYRRITKLKDGAEIFGIWISIVEIASKMPVRGILKDKDGDLTFEDMENIGGFPAQKYEKAIGILCSKEIGWLVRGNVGNFIKNNNLPESPDNLPLPPDDFPESPAYNTIHNKTIQDITGQDNTNSVKEIFEVFRKKYPGTKQGLEIEFKRFKAHKQDVNLLMPALELEIAHKEESQRKGLFTPQWKNLSTWINQRCWEQELPPLCESKIKSKGDLLFEDIIQGYSELGGH